MNLLSTLMTQVTANQIYSASLAQQRLWFLQQLQVDSAAYNVHVGLWLRGPLNSAALQSAFQEIVRRHDTLRTAFKLDAGKLLQVVTESCATDIPVTDLSAVAEPYAEAYELARQETAKPFDLSVAPLFRARLFRVTAEDHVFLCTMHHIVTDAWSLQILAKELALLYEAFRIGQPSSLPVLPISYGDFSEWQLENFQNGAVQDQVDYWKQKLAGAPLLLELPTDSPRPAEQTFRGASEIAPLPAATIGKIANVARQFQTTPFMVQLAAFKLLLSRYSRQPDILVGVPVAGRNRVETEGLIGFFVNTLVLRDDLSGNPLFPDLLAQVRETMLGALSNADVPFEKIVEVLQPERNLSFNPIFQVMFATIKSAVRSHQFGNLTAWPYVVNADTSIFDLSLTLIDGLDQQWWAQIEYNTDLFKRDRIAAMLEDFTALLGAIGANPEMRILEYSIPSIPGSGESALHPSNQTPAKQRESRTISPGRRGGTSHPVSKEEEFLVEVWKQVLGLSHVSTHDSFFDVGGHSLMAARLVATICEITGKQIPVSAIFRAPTIEEFAPLLQAGEVAHSEPLLLPLHEGDGRVPFFAIAAPGVDTFGFALLARHLGRDQSAYRVQASEPVVWGRPFSKEELRSLARQYVGAMRSVQRHGPYCVGGMCEGVLIAQEVILELESQGEDVGVFAIFDTWVLENSQIRALWAIDYSRQRFAVFRSAPRAEKRATVKRIFSRMFIKNGHANGSGWNRAYWPGEGFQEPTFHAPVLLFKRQRQPFYYVRDKQMGWGVRSKGGVEICELECEHAEMLRQPHVAIVGQILADRLQGIKSAQKKSDPELSVA